MRISMRNGIEIEPFKIGWPHLLIVAAAIGGYGVTLTNLVINQSESTAATNKLNETLIAVNSTLTEIKTDRKYDRQDIDSLKDQSKVNAAINKTQDEQIIRLQIVTGIRK